jgi:hypothetical protein
MSEDSSGPSCSIGSKPSSQHADDKGTVHYITLDKAWTHIQSPTLSALIIGAPWCSTCAMQKPHLPFLEQGLAARNIPLFYLEVESEYDVFLSPAHRAITMQLFSTPPGRKILPSGERYPDDTTSIIAIRGREFYPTLFGVKNASVVYANKNVATRDGITQAITDLSVL